MDVCLRDIYLRDVISCVSHGRVFRVYLRDVYLECISGTCISSVSQGRVSRVYRMGGSVQTILSTAPPR